MMIGCFGFGARDGCFGFGAAATTPAIRLWLNTDLSVTMKGKRYRKKIIGGKAFLSQ
jgi:hypothetical protein